MELRRQAKQTVRKILSMWVLILLLAVLAALMARLYFFQDALIFPRTREIYRTPADAPFQWEYEDVYVTVDGEKTHGWFIPLEDARGYVLFSHGNAGNIADRLESIQLLRRLGFSVLAYDYGGYGRSEGRPSEKRVYADVEAMWRYLTETRGIAPEEIVVFGRSLGGAAAAHLAAHTEPAAVVLESTFTSIPDVVRSIPLLGWVLAPGVRHTLPSIQKVPHIRAPLLIIHSEDDNIIPYAHGRRLYDAATPPKEFLDIQGDHNEGFVVSMPQYLDGWERFLAPLLPRP